MEFYPSCTIYMEDIEKLGEVEVYFTSSENFAHSTRVEVCSALGVVTGVSDIPRATKSVWSSGEVQQTYPSYPKSSPKGLITWVWVVSDPAMLP